ncbi:MAG: cupin domain-containing protein [Myxococcota bacterium]
MSASAVAASLLASTLLVVSGCATARSDAELAPGEPPVVEELAKSSHSWDRARLPAYPEGRQEVTILRITIPPGTRLHTHEHPVINAGVLLSGHLTVVKRDGATLQLEAGDPIVELVDTAHYGFNPGDVPAEIVVFYAGVVDQPITVFAPD